MRNYASVMGTGMTNRGGRKRFAAVSSHIRKQAVPQIHRMSEGRAYLNAVLMLALGQAAQKEIQKLYELPEMKGRYNAERAEIRSAFDHQRRFLKRDVPEEEYARFEGIVKGVADECTKRLDWLNTTILDQMVNRYEYPTVKSGALLGAAHGLVQCCNRLHRIMTGKDSSDYARILEELSAIDTKMDAKLLNEHIKPDSAICVDAVMKTVEDMQKAVMEVLGISNNKEGGDK